MIWEGEGGKWVGGSSQPRSRVEEGPEVESRPSKKKGGMKTVSGDQKKRGGTQLKQGPKSCQEKMKRLRENKDKKAGTFEITTKY